jgi:hypothetical protein
MEMPKFIRFFRLATGSCASPRFSGYNNRGPENAEIHQVLSGWGRSAAKKNLSFTNVISARQPQKRSAPYEPLALVSYRSSAGLPFALETLRSALICRAARVPAAW